MDRGPAGKMTEMEQALQSGDGVASHFTLEEIELLVEGKLDAAEAARVQSHVDACGACRDQLHEARENHALANDLRDAMTGGNTAAPPREQAGAGGASAGSEELPADSFPGYEVVREIHRGGQGVVYEGVEKKSRRSVAIKVMRFGPFAGRRERERFEREVEVLGQLDHPSIVSVRDGGTASGNFFFVMDYIAGEPLDVWLARGTRSVREILTLFVKICDAVNAAHLRGVIHRDLKPSNIRIDVRGEPHILDFGVAKYASDGPAAGPHPSAVTVTGQFLGSLPWASPEQAEGVPSRIDVRTDIYSLGVVLYHMLTRRFPYSVVGTMRDVLENIIRAEPTRPSTLSKDVDNEVETIVLKCLSKERERRYQTAGELARDIRHYLAGEPIEAKRDSGLYVLRKTLRRHRVAVAMAVGSALFLTAGLVIISALYVRAEGAKRGEAAERVRADEKARLAQAERDRARQNEQLANRRADQLRRSVYLNHITLSANALENGETNRMTELLYTCPPALRGWEWYRLAWLAAQRIMTFRTHDDIVSAAVFSPSGDQIATGGASGAGVRVWDARTGEVIRTLPGEKGSVILAIVFSPDGRSILTAGGKDGAVRVWDAEAGTESVVYRGHTKPVFDIACAPDGKNVATAGGDGMLRIWDMHTGADVLACADSKPVVRTVAFSPDGSWIASGGTDKLVRLRDAQTGAEVRTLPGHNEIVTCVAFSPDGQQLASGGLHRELKIWDVATGKAIADLPGFSGGRRSVTFSPDGTSVVGSGLNNTLRLWELKTQQETRTLRAHRSAVTSVTFSLDGTRVLTGSHDGTARIWRLSGEPGVTSTVLNAPHLSLAVLSADRTRLVTDDPPSLARGQPLEGKVSLWELNTGSKSLSIQAHGTRVSAVAFDPTGTLIASACDVVPAVTVRSAATGDECLRLAGHEAAVTSVAFSPKGQVLAAGAIDGSIRLWVTQTGAERTRIEGGTDPVLCLAFSPDGRVLAAGGRDKILRLWDAASGLRLREFHGHEAAIEAIAFSPDGARVVSGGGDCIIRTWSLASGASVNVLRGHDDAVRSLAFNADGSRIASASDDATVRLWDAAAGVEALVLRGHEWATIAVGFAPSDGHLVSVDAAGTVRQWYSVTHEQLSAMPEAAFAMASGAESLAAQGQNCEARLVYEEAIEAYERLFGEKDDRTVGLKREYAELPWEDDQDSN